MRDLLQSLWKGIACLGPYVAPVACAILLAATLLSFFVGGRHIQMGLQGLIPDKTLHIGQPAVFARERLLNEQLAESATLRKELQDVETDPDAIQKILSTSSIQQLELSVSQGPNSNTPDPAAPAQQKPTSQPDAAQSLSLLDRLLNRESLRTRLAAELAQSEFGDSEDTDGFNLFRVQIPVSLTPGQDTSDTAAIEVVFHPPLINDEYLYKLYVMMLGEASAIETEGVGQRPGVIAETQKQRLEDEVSGGSYYKKIFVLTGNDDSCGQQIKFDAQQPASSKCLPIWFAVPMIRNNDWTLGTQALNYALVGDAFGQTTALTMGYFSNFSNSWSWPKEDAARNSDRYCFGDKYYGVPQLRLWLPANVQAPDQVNDPAYLYHISDWILKNGGELVEDLKRVNDDVGLDTKYQQSAQQMLRPLKKRMGIAKAYFTWYENIRNASKQVCKVEKYSDDVDPKHPEVAPSFRTKIKELKQPARVVRLLPQYRSVGEQMSINAAQSIGGRGSALAGSNNVGASIYASRGKTSEGIISESSVIGYLGDGAWRTKDGLSDPSQAGWFLRPDRNTASDPASWVQGDRTEVLSTDVLIPSLWFSTVLTVRTGWLSNGDKLDGEEKSFAFEVPLARSSIDFEEFAATVAERGSPSVKPLEVEWPADLSLNSCKSDVDIIIRGANLWHSPQVFLGGQEASSVSVLPDMNGLVAHFNPSKLPANGDGTVLAVDVATALGFQKAGDVKVANQTACPSPVNH